MPLFGPPNVEKLQEKGNLAGLIKALGYQKDGSVREKAAKALGEMGDAQAVEPLITALKDSDVDVRRAAVEALGQSGDARAVDPLGAALKDSDTDVRRAAAEALGQSGDAGAVDPLGAALEDSDVDVRQAAAEALGQSGDARAVDPLIAALKDSAVDVQQTAAGALAQIAEENTDKDLKYQAALALAEIDDPRAVNLLVGIVASQRFSAMMHGRESSLEEGALQALVGMGSPAVDPLIQCLRPHLVKTGHNKSKNINHGRNMVAVESLVRIGDSRAVEPLAGYLSSYKGEDERSKAAWALGELNDPSARESLVEGLKDRAQSVRSEAAEALLKLGLIPEEVENKIRYHVARKDVDACVEIGQPAADTLITMLGYEYRADFPFVARALGKIGDPRVVKPLVAAFEQIDEDSNPEEFNGVVDSLLDVGEPAVDELIAALKRVDDPYDYEKNRAANGAACVLVKMGETRAVEPLISILQYGGSAQYAAQKKLAEFGSLAVDGLLVALAEPPSYKAISGIAQTLSQIGDKKAIGPLITALGYEGHNAYEVTKQVAFALGKLTGNDYGNDRARWEAWWDKQNQ
jgi:HEAT repeat protein